MTGWRTTEFAAEPRGRVTGVMRSVLADVPATQLTPMSKAELVRATKRRLERRTTTGGRSAGFR